MSNRYVIIMAGGIGSRFWPLSRRSRPKQFIDILGTGESLLQQTYRRFCSVCAPENILIVTNTAYKNLIVEHIGINPDNVLCEPTRRNTAPCIAYGIFKILVKDPDAVVAITPADHFIEKESIFTNDIIKSFEFAEDNDVLITMGIKPNRPETGYGYIQADKSKVSDINENFVRVRTFTEKPNRDMASMFIQSGDFFWNAGIFISSIKSLLAAYEIYLPDIYKQFLQAEQYFNTPNEYSILSHVYNECRNISIDYGIMEKADNVYVHCIDIGWSDLGTWGSVYEHTEHDENENSIIGGKVISYHSNSNLIKTQKNKLTIIDGMDNYIVVDTDDVLLIVKKDDEQNIKQYLDSIERDQTLTQYL